MKLPSPDLLSKEQAEACYSRPIGTTLVVGPAGSGKTVVAVYRQNHLNSFKTYATALAWNNVLSVYAGMSETFETWHNRWWKSEIGSEFPKFPANEYGYRSPNYQEAINYMSSNENIIKSVNWGNLILDEAQDYNFTAHKFLAYIQSKNANDTISPSSLMILADDNQIITERNSRIPQIVQAHSINSKDIYYLTKNYRNTREIAEVANEFYVGNPNDLPTLPERSGDRPSLNISCSLDNAINHIHAHAVKYPSQEIGVLVFYDETRIEIVNKLTNFPQLRNRIQTYGHEEGKSKAQDLNFVQPGKITVLCYASAKGVEFDAVFLPKFHQPNPLDAIRNKMIHYVVVSRARSHLTLMSDTPDLPPNIFNFIGDRNRICQLFDVN